ncbi:MAG: glutamine--fructose-6-phosphate transaminase (isomerizing), partial [Pseudomonadota bacterium]
MCGIVGAVAERNVVQILLEGLRRLEYRGYDSAGVALIQRNTLNENQLNGNELTVIKRTGKVESLNEAINTDNGKGTTGIAHTRWATHGGVTEINAHPHLSQNRFAIAHNGIIENYKHLRAELNQQGYEFATETDSETIAHCIAAKMAETGDLLEALLAAVNEFEGAYGTVVIDKENPDVMVAARSGSPLVIGLGIGENFIASDQMALFPVTRRFIFLEEGDVARVTRTSVTIINSKGEQVTRDAVESSVEHDMGDKGGYRHYMLKEIHEQPTVIRNTLKDRVTTDGLAENIFGANSDAIFEKTQFIKIIACGTSYHAGVTAKYWIEQFAGVQSDVEIASEFRYRKSIVPANSLIVTISQSGETADTLAALRMAKEQGYMSSLAICNVAGSSLVRESEMSFMTRAGTEIGVASTKAFTTQLASMLMFAIALGQRKGMSDALRSDILAGLSSLPTKLEESLALSEEIEDLAEEFADKHHSLFLGRGDQYPIAMEGALKLKEISYIHAEAYASGELKHGPLALIDAEMPVIVVAPNNELLEKLHSNVEEVRARGG